jgi:hypothetical protein
MLSIRVEYHRLFPSLGKMTTLQRGGFLHLEQLDEMNLDRHHQLQRV